MKLRSMPVPGFYVQTILLVCAVNMNHHIFTGTFASLEFRLIHMVTERQAQDPLAPVRVVVGSNVLASHLKIRLADRGKACANVRFHTFLDLAATLSEAAPAEAKPVLPPMGASLLLQEILEAGTPEVFARVAGFPGFRGAMLETLRDLRDAGISAEMLAASLPNIRGITPDRSAHLHALAALYRQFCVQAAAFRDAADLFVHATRTAPRAAVTLGTDTLLVYGIYDVTGLQADLLHSLERALRMMYFVPYSGGAASGFALPFLETLKRNLGVAPEALPDESRNDSLGTLVKRIFSLPAANVGERGSNRLSQDGSFALVTVPGDSLAAVEVLREVLRAVREKVISGFYEAAVILRRPAEEAPGLAEAFRLRNIPYFIHGGSAFTRRPLAQAVLAVTALEKEGFSRRTILAAMELIAAALPAASGSAWDAPQWRALVNDARFLAGMDSWDKGTDALIREAQAQLERAKAAASSGESGGQDEYPPMPVPLASQRLQSAVSLRSGWMNLRQAVTGWPEIDTWQGWSDLILRRLKPLLGESEDWPALSAAVEDLASLGGFRGTAVSTKQVSRGRALSFLSEALSGLSYPEGRLQARGINLLSAAAARGLRFPLVIVPGLDEGRFPARLRQDPLLLDAERQQIGRPPSLPLKSLRGEEEKLLFDMAVRAAEKRLVLLTSRLDETSDRERIPSQFFLRCASAARGSAVQLRELNSEEVPGLRSVNLDQAGSGKGQLAVDEGEIRLGLISEEPDHARAVLQAVARLEPLLMKGPMAYDKARWIHGLTPFDGSITDAASRSWVAQKLAAPSSQISASRIEEYAACPYMFFLRRVQELGKWEEEERLEGLDPLVRGRMLHLILEDFVRDYSGDAFAVTPVEVLREELSVRARRALEADRPSAMPDLLWEIERDRLLAMLQAWLLFERDRADSGFRPLQLERAFGTFPDERHTPPYLIQGSAHRFEFRGRIDRIDVRQDGCSARVIDYKSGFLPETMSSGKRTLLMAGEKIQLAIYGGALSVMEEFAAVQHIEGEYLHLQSRDGSIIACAYQDAELRAAIERLPELLEIIQEGVGKGDFFARASGSVRPYGHCSYCDFLLICGKDRMQRQRIKSADPAVLRFNRLSEVDGGTEEEE